MNVRFEVTVDAGVFFRDEVWLAGLPVPIRDDLVVIAGREYTTLRRTIRPAGPGPFVTVEVWPVKLPFIRSSWFVKEEPSGD